MALFRRAGEAAKVQEASVWLDQARVLSRACAEATAGRQALSLAEQALVASHFIKAYEKFDAAHAVPPPPPPSY